MSLPEPLLAHPMFASVPSPLPTYNFADGRGPDPIVAASVRAEIDQGVELLATTASGRTLTVGLRVAGEGVVRVTLAAVGEERTRYRLARTSESARAQLSLGEKEVLLEAEGVQLRCGLRPFRLELRGSAGKPLVESAGPETDAAGTIALLPFGVSEVADDRICCHAALTSRPDEAYFGFGEKFGSYDKRGQRLEMWNYDALGVHSERAYKNVPFFLSSKGYGVFVDSTYRVVFDLAAAHHSAVSVLADEEVLDMYLVAGPDPRDILRRYSTLVGFPTLPPRWAFGYWVSSGYLHDSHDQAMGRAQAFRQQGIPADVFHLDCYWQRDYQLSDLVWDRDSFPHPQDTLNRIKELGYHVSLWLNPCLSVDSERFAEARDGGHLLTDASGGPYVADLWAGTQPPVGIIDFTSPDTVRWFQDLLRPLIRLGAEVLKTDMGEGVPEDASASNGMNGRQLHNLYPLLYNDAVAAVLREETGKDPLLWCRSTFAGGQRHSAQWGGDPECTFGAMAATLRGGLSLGTCGHPFWSHDIGGLHGRPTTELFVRWAQFGLLSPLSRAHGTTTRLPWDYGQEALEIFRRFSFLRYRLIPYLYTCAVESARSGFPMMRALALEFPDDPGAVAADLEYLLGPDLLVAPVCDPGGEREVYIPVGKWIDYWTNEVVDGPSWKRICSPLETLPLFVRANALIPTIEAAQRVDDAPFRDVTFLGYLLDEGQAVLHDIDGTTTVWARVGEGGTETGISGAKKAARLALVPIQGLRQEEEVVELHQ